MSHHHDHPETSWGRRLIATMIMNLIIPAVQIYGGILSGSMALISDALHNLMDFVSVLISYAALRLGRRGPSLEQTFGYKRLEVLGALLNVALLFGASFYILVESWGRLLDPQPIKGNIVIWAALIGFAANLISTMMLRSGARVNLNMRGAFLHMLTDALTSLGVAVLGVVWLYRPWYWLDPVISSMIIAMDPLQRLGCPEGGSRHPDERDAPRHRFAENQKRGGVPGRHRGDASPACMEHVLGAGCAGGSPHRKGSDVEQSR